MPSSLCKGGQNKFQVPCVSPSCDRYQGELFPSGRTVKVAGWWRGGGVVGWRSWQGDQVAGWWSGGMAGWWGGRVARSVLEWWVGNRSIWRPLLSSRASVPPCLWLPNFRHYNAPFDGCPHAQPPSCAIVLSLDPCPGSPEPLMLADIMKPSETDLSTCWHTQARLTF